MVDIARSASEHESYELPLASASMHLHGYWVHCAGLEKQQAVGSFHSIPLAQVVTEKRSLLHLYESSAQCHCIGHPGTARPSLMIGRIDHARRCTHRND